MNQANGSGSRPEANQDDLFLQRLGKLSELREESIDPFGGRFEKAVSIAAVRRSFSENGEEGGTTRIAGRLMASRDMGKSIFADIMDSDGRMQIYLQKNNLQTEEFNRFKKVDVGDIIGVDGELFVTRRGELTVKVSAYELLCKSMRPLPEKWHGLTDVERRYRQRYLDLIVNEDSRRIFRQRSEVIREIRSFLVERGFMEVETPMLQPLAGGAAAKPFETYYEALRSPMYMRIAPELYLKRLLVGGFDKVFELNRNFRNEGMSRRHNPEFTMVEIYQAYTDCRGMMDLIEALIVTVAERVMGTLKLERADGTTIDLTPPWRRVPYRDLVMEKAGADWFNLSSDERRNRAKEMDLTVEDSTPDFEVTNEVYEKLIETELIQPTFVTRLPAELVPLAKACADDDSLVDVFELEINGQELAPGYSELNDPLEQRRRFEEQAKRGEMVAAAAESKIDEDFLTALEHGMPPAGGMGIGVDRLVMTLTGAESIRDVILFPQLRPKN